MRVSECESGVRFNGTFVQNADWPEMTALENLKDTCKYNLLEPGQDVAGGDASEICFVRLDFVHFNSLVPVTGPGERGDCDEKVYFT